jgi:hypothetical protein
MSRVPTGGTRASSSIGGDVGAIVTFGLLGQAPLEQLARRLASKADPRAGVVGLALQLA